ncbi:MAG: hypothetical protein HY681_13795 [Chloroflexi bacterium]|nr:hypothetical protein [Chloroflexota bacterium]
MEIATVERRADRRTGRGLFRVTQWWLIGLLVVVALVVLALAEAVWLKGALPREYVARASLVVVPAPGSVFGGTSEWMRAVVDSASGEAVLADVSAVLRAQNHPAREALSPELLHERMRFSALCVQVPDSRGNLVRGVLVSTTIRGVNSGEAAVADAWAAVLLRRGALLAGDATASSARYLPCEEP